jgi:hypothetical protein
LFAIGPSRGIGLQGVAPTAGRVRGHATRISVRQGVSSAGGHSRTKQAAVEQRVGTDKAGWCARFAGSRWSPALPLNPVLCAREWCQPHEWVRCPASVSQCSARAAGPEWRSNLRRTVVVVGQSAMGLSSTPGLRCGRSSTRATEPPAEAGEKRVVASNRPFPGRMCRGFTLVRCRPKFFDRVSEASPHPLWGSPAVAPAPGTAGNRGRFSRWPT